MPLLRIKEIKEMTPEERAKKLMDLKAELMRLKTMIKAGGNIENPARIKQLRKAIARILTIEGEQRLKLKSKGGGKKQK
ncbi:MAG: 50S ribosomal protein L29 [Candidatus Bathyarchaeota archaeon]|nr:50S ribosomal protein L29 [Candidatus Bathyarchaeota archaeon]MCX8176903.1 50S ribosomal protein L29 [Candidatus Bathyarchaeota archaeon]MDW8193410.1 50S ribosomal protein L29 [Nitrososphaerota archaeon]